MGGLRLASFKMADGGRLFFSREQVGLSSANLSLGNGECGALS